MTHPSSRTGLAPGCPFEGLGPSKSGAGAVKVIYGGRTALTAAGNQLWHQDSPGIDDEAEPTWFGSSLTAADLNGDGHDDLAVGVNLEDLGETRGKIVAAGAVHVIYGGRSALTAAGNQLWHQDSPGIADEAENDPGYGHAEQFGRELLGRDFIDSLYSHPLL